MYCRWPQLCEAAFTPRGDSTNCNSRVSLQQRAPRHWSGVHYHHWSYGHFRWTFQQATFGKRNIRFTPTNSSNPILMAHSCGLGGKYWYKHTKVFQTEHLKRIVQCGLNLTFFFLLADSVKSAHDILRQMLLLYEMQDSQFISNLTLFCGDP